MMKAGLLGVAVLLGATACTDDHFDVKSNTGTGANTLWQNIQSTADLSEVASILQRTKVMKSETDRGQKQSYADLLDQSQEFTAWLPKNGSFDAQSYLDRLSQADSLAATHVLADSVSALRINYEVGNQFVRNHVARFNYSAITSSQQIRMLNGKLLTYDVANNTFNDVAITSSNIMASNGTLHVINGVSPFAYNIYDFLSYDSRTSKLFAAIDEFNVYEFSPSSSTEGTMNNEGKMEYVDSIYVRSNDLLSNASLSGITNEDSVFVAVFPSDECYDAAREKLAKFFNYASTYNYEWSSANHDFNYKSARGYKPNVDSLTNAKVLDAILTYSVASASNISASNMHNKEALLTRAVTADSILLLSGNYLYNTNRGGVNPYFGVSTVQEGIDNAQKASNGYVYPVDNYELKAENFYSQKMYAATGYNLADVQNCSSGTGSYTLLNSDNWNDTIDLGGLLDENYYTYFPVSGNNQMLIDFRLQEIYSNMPYKISIVTLPNNVNINNVRIDNSGNIIEETPRFDALLIDDKGNTLDQQRQLYVNTTKVEKMTLWESYTFPYCYAGIPNSYETFPRLRIRVTYPYQNRGNFKALSLGRLIIEPADTSESE